MTSNRSPNAPIGFWRDWVTRLGIGAGAVAFIGNFIYIELQNAGIVRHQQDPFEFEAFGIRYLGFPLLMSVY
jgi:hypothetical protein